MIETTRTFKLMITAGVQLVLRVTNHSSLVLFIIITTKNDLFSSDLFILL